MPPDYSPTEYSSNSSHTKWVGAFIVLGGLLVLAGVFDFVQNNLPVLDALWPFLLVIAGLICMSGTKHRFLGVSLLIGSLLIMAFKYSLSLTNGSRGLLGISVVLIGILVLMYSVKPAR